MRVAIYDKNPGVGTWQNFLCLTWKIGCFLHKLFGKLDKYYGAESWEDAIQWLIDTKGPYTSIQYWGHGSPGCAWLADKSLHIPSLAPLRTMMAPVSVLWFRNCSMFQGRQGYDVSFALTTLLSCTVAGYTRTIGFLQSGLHTRKPNELPSWSMEEKDEGPAWMVGRGLQWGNNTIFCLRASIPKGW